MTMMLYIYN